MDKPARRVVEAEEFGLVDSKGRLRACIGTSEEWNGAPAVTLYDASGIPRLSLQLDDDLPRIFCYSPSGQPVVTIGTHEDGEPTLCLTRADGRVGFWVRLWANEDTAVHVFDKDGQPIKRKR